MRKTISRSCLIRTTLPQRNRNSAQHWQHCGTWDPQNTRFLMPTIQSSLRISLTYIPDRRIRWAATTHLFARWQICRKFSTIKRWAQEVWKSPLSGRLVKTAWITSKALWSTWMELRPVRKTLSQGWQRTWSQRRWALISELPSSSRWHMCVRPQRSIRSIWCRDWSYM